MQLAQKKWRPSLWFVVLCVVLTLIALPLAGLLAARLTSNQFVRETEASLNHQAALFGASYAALYQASRSEVDPNLRREKVNSKGAYAPIPSSLRARDVDVAPPEPRIAIGSIDPFYLKIGARLTQLGVDAQRTTLAGYKAVDPKGRIIGGTGITLMDIGHIPEVSAALRGNNVSSLRWRADRTGWHPLSSLSRDTKYRVFVAQPVIVEGRIIGAVYLSRTPLNLGKFLYQEAGTIAIMAIFVMLAGCVVGFILWRLIYGPLHGLETQSEAIIQGRQSELTPLSRYGTREAASLADSLGTMAQRLTQRAEALRAYSAHVTHELKSPVTSILGAAELLEGSSARMSEEQRAKFYGNIKEDAGRMARLLDELRELARVKMGDQPAQADLSETVKIVQSEHPKIKIDLTKGDDQIPLSPENAQIVLGQLAQNAHQHGASELRIHWDSSILKICDNGKGIPDDVAPQIFDLFFTTKRDAGGTGMGLAIVAGLLEAQGAEITLSPENQKGACFNIRF